jgi:hypothetical protein
MRPKRNAALVATERINKIARWESCSENSSEFRAVAAQIEAELQMETRRGVVKHDDLDEVYDCNDAHARGVSNEETGSIASEDANESSDAYESSFIDDEEESTQDSTGVDDGNDNSDENEEEEECSENFSSSESEDSPQLTPTTSSMSVPNDYCDIGTNVEAFFQADTESNIESIIEPIDIYENAESVELDAPWQEICDTMPDDPLL